MTCTELPSSGMFLSRNFDENLIPVLAAFILSGFLPMGPSAVDFQTEIVPILKNRCGKCHMDGESKGKVSLDANLISKEIGDDGSIVPGDVKGSDLHWTMTLSPDDDLCMPPKGPACSQGRNRSDRQVDRGRRENRRRLRTGRLPRRPCSMTDSGNTDGDTMTGGEMTGDMAGATRKPYEGIFKNNEGMQVPG